MLHLTATRFRAFRESLSNDFKSRWPKRVILVPIFLDDLQGMGDAGLAHQSEGPPSEAGGR